MKKLPTELFNKYKENPSQYEEEVRKYCNIPENKYYTVSIWPIEGEVRLNGLNREVKSKKISKSDKNNGY